MELEVVLEPTKRKIIAADFNSTTVEISISTTMEILVTIVEVSVKAEDISDIHIKEEVGQVVEIHFQIVDFLYQIMECLLPKVQTKDINNNCQALSSKYPL